jgi:hypothetical protein
MAKAKSETTVACSFCGKKQKQVKKLIAGPGVYICGECIELCNLIIEEEAGGKAPTPISHPERTEEQEIERMVALHHSKEQVDREVAVAVRGLRAQGVTWTRIGEALGMTRQSAWERYFGED